MSRKDDMARLDDRTIVSIGWWFDPSEYNCIAVGRNGVTKIDCAEQYCGEYSIHWLQVWRDDTLLARYNARNVDNVVYEDGWAT